MILEQSCAGFGEAAGAVIGNERLEAGATGDVIGGQAKACPTYARPDAGGSGFHHGVIDGLITNIGHGLVKFLVHATPP
jgi:hypothetical protein